MARLYLTPPLRQLPSCQPSAVPHARGRSAATAVILHSCCRPWQLSCCEAAGPLGALPGQEPGAGGSLRTWWWRSGSDWSGAAPHQETGTLSVRSQPSVNVLMDLLKLLYWFCISRQFVWTCLLKIRWLFSFSLIWNRYLKKLFLFLIPPPPPFLYC